MKYLKEKEVAKRLLACGYKFAQNLNVAVVDQHDFSQTFAQDMARELSKVFVDSCKEMNEQEQEYASNTYVFYKRVEKEIKNMKE